MEKLLWNYGVFKLSNNIFLIHLKTSKQVPNNLTSGILFKDVFRIIIINVIIHPTHTIFPPLKAFTFINITNTDCYLCAAASNINR